MRCLDLLAGSARDTLLYQPLAIRSKLVQQGNLRHHGWGRVDIRGDKLGGMIADSVLLLLALSVALLALALHPLRLLQWSLLTLPSRLWWSAGRCNALIC